MYFSCQERGKKPQTIDYRRQSNNYRSICATSYGRGHSCASREMTDD
jgi:hypothetical protein